MRNLIVGFLALFLGVLIAVPAVAQGKKAKDGVVQSVDAGAGKVTLVDGVTLATNAKTKVTRNGSPARLAELKEGDRVKYLVEEGATVYVHAEGPR